MFSVGHRSGYISVALSEGFLCFLLVGDVPPGDIEMAMGLAVEDALLRPDNRVLVDIRRFTGSIDWGMIRDLRRHAPWSTNAQNSVRCAYLLPDNYPRFLTILASFYPGAKHRAFKDDASALRWLVQVPASACA
ncbi:STAS/SEC14 domain-containing protein [Niveispirillum cyanobacteriorum]|uniref:Uncharacterized protein n=2 Tax=Niveispirillum cyanobacteriorum TaxID=1612173 RepID=A0A2K9N7H8_9PROT|nr:STAS/SEC14 domain-containing protein [Niveispirillum cyanobacteriorum]AUN29098.1 hypothetical protein C0V82_01675 [Niveispirillum cyanobacteriorum]GGE67506.1 hypothetical protein GCM10011317_25980 [Niveispirillum cyanobacteriorum]